LNALRLDMTESEKEFMESQRRCIESTAETGTKLVNNFYSQQMKPVLAELALNVGRQAEELQLLRETVCRDLETLVRDVNIFSVETAENVQELRKAVEEYAQSNEDRVNKLTTKNKEIKDSEANIKSLLEALMANYAAHSQLVQSNTKDIKETTEEDVVKVGELVTKSENTVTKVEERKTLTLEKIGEGEVKISGFVKEVTKKCQDINEEVLEKSTSIGNFTEVHIKESKENWVHHTEELETLSKAHTTNMEGKQTNLVKVMKSNKAQLGSKGDSVKQEIDGAKDLDEAAALKLATEVERVGDECEATMKQFQERIHTEKETVTSFIEQVLQTDQPSGLTPARTVRQFPRYLEATSPHDRILQRYRSQAEAAVVAARLPLEDSDNEDSLMSTSGEALSRESSDGEITLKRRNSLQEGSGLRRTNSQGSNVKITPQTTNPKRTLSRSNSRTSSRENSATDLRSKVATSDFGSEPADNQENRDPNFKKPNHKQVSKKATGLKKPEGKQRTQLGSQNS